MAMVMPRARSSGALSMESNERNSASPLRASTLVRAAVRVVLPWSTWPMVPTFTCGFVRSNFAFAIELIPIGLRVLSPAVYSLARFRHDLFGLALRHFIIVREFHRVHRAPLRHRA